MNLAARIYNRIVNRPSAVQKRAYLELKKTLEPCIAEAERPVLIISGISLQTTGLFCDLLAYLRWVQFAEKMGYTAVIDMENVPNLYLEDNLLGKVNSYEYFYHQPMGMSLDEAYRAKKIYIVNRLNCPYDFTHRQKQCYREVTAVKDWIYGENRDKYFAEYKRLYDRYFRVTEEAAAFTDRQWNSLVAPGEKTLGLLCRGTDYFTKRPYAHRIQPTIGQILEKVDSFLAEHPVDKIFVATEDESIYSALREHYGARLVAVQCPRVSTEGKECVADAFGKRHLDRKMNGLYYYASIACLSRCDHLIAGKTMATQFIRTMRDRDFETEFYWELGRYGIDDR